MWKVHTKIENRLKYLFLVFTLLFSACSIKDYEQTKSKIIIIKSPQIKFADLGYIRSSDKAIELELFIAGTAIKKITINHLVCIDEGCMSKSGFNREYMYENYPDELLQNILLGLEIYDGQNRVKTDDSLGLTTVNPIAVRKNTTISGIPNTKNPTINVNMAPIITISNTNSIRYPDIALYVSSCFFMG